MRHDPGSGKGLGRRKGRGFKNLKVQNKKKEVVIGRELIL